MAETLEAAFVAAKNQIENPPLDGENPHFHNRFATLPLVLNTVRKVCTPHGITYTQRIIAGNDTSLIQTYVMGSDGTKIELSSLSTIMPQNPQAFGSHLTYMRRYIACLDWGIAGEDDDDGNEASQSVSEAVVIPKSNKTTDKRKVASQKPARDRFKHIAELKAECLTAGIKEEGIREWLYATFPGKPMSQFSDDEIKVVEDHLGRLLDSAHELSCVV